MRLLSPQTQVGSTAAATATRGNKHISSKANNQHLIMSVRVCARARSYEQRTRLIRDTAAARAHVINPSGRVRSSFAREENNLILWRKYELYIQHIHTLVFLIRASSSSSSTFTAPFSAAYRERALTVSQTHFYGSLD